MTTAKKTVEEVQAQIVVDQSAEFERLESHIRNIKENAKEGDELGAVFSDEFFPYIHQGKSLKERGWTWTTLAKHWGMSDTTLRNYRLLGMVRDTSDELGLHVPESVDAGKNLCGDIVDPETGKSARAPRHQQIPEFHTRLREFSELVASGMEELEASQAVRGLGDTDTARSPKSSDQKLVEAIETVANRFDVDDLTDEIAEECIKRMRAIATTQARRLK